MNDFEIIKTDQLQPGDINITGEFLRIVLDIVYRFQRDDYKIIWLWENGTTTVYFYSGLTPIKILKTDANANNNHKTN